MVKYVEVSVKAGVEDVAGSDHENLFVKPPLLANVTNDIAVSCNEHFGLITPVIPFTDNEAIDIASDTEYGLTALVISIDLAGQKLSQTKSRLEWFTSTTSPSTTNRTFPSAA